MVLDSDNRWWFTVDAVNHRVQRFESKGQRINSWGSLGSGDGDLRRPSNIAINPVDGCGTPSMREITASSGTIHAASS